MEPWSSLRRRLSAAKTTYLLYIGITQELERVPANNDFAGDFCLQKRALLIFRIDNLTPFVSRRRLRNCKFHSFLRSVDYQEKTVVHNRDTVFGDDL
jgi:hypothetical protein